MEKSCVVITKTISNLWKLYGYAPHVMEVDTRNSGIFSDLRIM